MCLVCLLQLRCLGLIDCGSYSLDVSSETKASVCMEALRGQMSDVSDVARGATATGWRCLQRAGGLMRTNSKHQEVKSKWREKTPAAKCVSPSRAGEASDPLNFQSGRKGKDLRKGRQKMKWDVCRAEPALSWLGVGGSGDSLPRPLRRDKALSFDGSCSHCFGIKEQNGAPENTCCGTVS